MRTINAGYLLELLGKMEMQRGKNRARDARMIMAEIRRESKILRRAIEDAEENAEATLRSVEMNEDYLAAR